MLIFLSTHRPTQKFGNVVLYQPHVSLDITLDLDGHTFMSFGESQKTHERK